MVPPHVGTSCSLPCTFFHKTVFIKHASVVDILCNHKSAIESWSLGTTPTCCCQGWRQFQPAAPNPDSDHWVLSGSLLTGMLPSDVAVLAEGSLQNKVFPQKRDFIQSLQCGILNWCKYNGLPSIPKAQVHDLGQTLWSTHTTLITNHITRSSIQQLENLFPGVVFHCEDKRASSLRIFGPCLYHTAIERTFLDPDVFGQVDDEPEVIMSTLVTQLESQYGKSYPWAVGKGRQLPAGYILAKEEELRKWSPHHILCGCSLQTHAQHLGSNDLSTHSCGLPGPFCHRGCLPSPLSPTTGSGTWPSSDVQPRPGWILYQHRSKKVSWRLVHALGFSKTPHGCQRQ